MHAGKPRGYMRRCGPDASLQTGIRENGIYGSGNHRNDEAGPEKGAAALLEQYTGLVWSVCGRRLENPEDIRECVNTAFAEFCAGFERFCEEKECDKPPGWVRLTLRDPVYILEQSVEMKVLVK